MDFSRENIHNLYLVLKNSLTRKGEALLPNFPVCLAYNTYTMSVCWFEYWFICLSVTIKNVNREL